MPVLLEPERRERTDHYRTPNSTVRDENDAGQLGHCEAFAN
jgi:hypothetical protein